MKVNKFDAVLKAIRVIESVVTEKQKLAAYKYVMLVMRLFYKDYLFLGHFTHSSFIYFVRPKYHMIQMESNFLELFKQADIRIGQQTK